MCQVSVVVPVYNEIDNLEALCDAVYATFASMPGVTYELIIVNDGSTDATRETLDEMTEKYNRLRPFHLEKNRGQSAALIYGLRQARGEYILTLDGDMQNDPADFPKVLELLESYDCVCGYREHRHDSPIRRLSSRVANKVRNWLLQDGIRDSGCGLKGFRAVCIPHFIPFNGMHRFVAVFMRTAGLSIVECPVQHHPRTRGVSKYGLNNRLWRSLYDLIGVAWLRKRYVG